MYVPPNVSNLLEMNKLLNSRKLFFDEEYENSAYITTS